MLHLESIGGTATTGVEREDHCCCWWWLKVLELEIQAFWEEALQLPSGFHHWSLGHLENQHFYLQCDWKHSGLGWCWDWFTPSVQDWQNQSFCQFALVSLLFVHLLYIYDTRVPDPLAARHLDPVSSCIPGSISVLISSLLSMWAAARGFMRCSTSQTTFHHRWSLNLYFATCVVEVNWNILGKEFHC